MAVKIAHVQPGSIAARIGLKAGELLMTIAGEPIIDQIDYQALTANTVFTMEIRSVAGIVRKLNVRKKDWQPLGITLDQAIVASPRECANHCIFCFIDQMPPNMRDTLYVKDDDWRLSLMMGNYITMTNINDAQLDRIIRRRVSPLYISVQATEPQLRCRLLKNDRAGQLMDRLRLLANNGIRFHCQVVLCPGWNDGEHLERTLQDLMSLHPFAQSVALVPVGLTKFREGLDVVRPYDKASAAALVHQCEAWQQTLLVQLGSRFVFPSDEFYCLSGLPLPQDDEYEDYPQIENGVGMLRMFETDLAFAAQDEPVEETKPRTIVLACGTSVAGIMQKWCDRFAPKGTVARVHPILNKFFGESVTVSGLITGQDLTDQLKDEQCDEILIVRDMLRSDGDLFLDNMSLTEAQSLLPAPIRVVRNTGLDFWRAISGQEVQ